MNPIACFLAAWACLVMVTAAQGQVYNSNPQYAAPGTYSYGGTIYGPGGSIPSYGTGSYMNSGSYLNNGNYVNPYGNFPVNQPTTTYPYGGGPRYLPVYPTYGGGYSFSGAPVALPGDYFGINSGGRQYRYWRAPSGYYYPWVAGGYGYAPPVIIYQQGAPEPAKPSLSTVFQDMQTMLDNAVTKGKLQRPDYEHLNRRLNDLKRMQQSALIQGQGTVDSAQDAELRQQLNLLGVEISRRLRA